MFSENFNFIGTSGEMRMKRGEIFLCNRGVVKGINVNLWVTQIAPRHTFLVEKNDPKSKSNLTSTPSRPSRMRIEPRGILYPVCMKLRVKRINIAKY